MTKFYTHIIEIDSLLVELNEMDLSDTEKKHLADLIDSNIHHTVLDAILTHLSDEDKKIFMEHLARGDHQKIWDHLNEKVDNIEEKIKKAANQVKEELHRDIKEARTK